VVVAIVVRLHGCFEENVDFEKMVDDLLSINSGE
jgi:hypothetical protein